MPRPCRMPSRPPCQQVFRQKTASVRPASTAAGVRRGISNRNIVAATLLAATSVFGPLPCHAATPEGKPATGKRPNLIIMVTDDQRWDASGRMQQHLRDQGKTARFPWLIGRTPGMDRLAAEGVLFDNAFVTHSLCSPSRACMLSGRYPHLAGVKDNVTRFPVDSTTWATILRDHGYATGYFGKWHMLDQAERPGFDTVATYLNQGKYFDNDFLVNGAKVREKEWVDDVSTRYLLDFIGRQAESGKPFAAFLGFKSPHDPRQPPARHSARFENDKPLPPPNASSTPPYRPDSKQGAALPNLRDYFETLAGVDDNVARVLDTLDRLGLARDTAVLFLGDNGYFLGEHGLGDKRAAYEESMRIPFFLRYPALQPKPVVRSQLVLNLDLAPTVLDLAGVGIPPSMQGRSLKPLVTGIPVAWRESFLFTYFRDAPYPEAVPPLFALRRADGWKLVRYRDRQDWTELFDTANDPHELRNLAADPACRERRAGMERELDDALAKVQPLP